MCLRLKVAIKALRVTTEVFLVLTLATIGQASAESIAIIDDDRRQISALRKPAIDQYNAGRFENAIEEAHAALSELDALEDPKLEWGRAYILRDIATYAYRRGDLELALKSAADASDVASSVEDLTSRQVARFLAYEGFLSFLEGECTRSLELYRQAYQLLVQDLGESHEATFGVERNLWTVFLETENLDAARRHVEGIQNSERRQERASELATAEADYRGTRAAVTEDAASATGGSLPDAQAAIEQSRFSEAIQMLDSYIAENEGRQDEKLNVASAYIKRGKVRFLQGKFYESTSDYLVAIRLYDETQHLKTPAAGDVYLSLANSYDLLNELDRAERYYDFAIEVYERCPGTFSAKNASALVERSWLYRKNGRIQKSVADVTLAVNILDDRDALASERGAYAKATMGFLQSQVGRTSAAKRSLEDAVSMLEQLQGEYSPNLVPGYLELARIAIRQGDLDSGEVYAEKAVAIRRHNLATSGWGLASALAVLSEVREALGQTRSAIELADESVKVVESRVQLPLVNHSVDRLAEQKASRDIYEHYLDLSREVGACESGDPRQVARAFEVAQLPHVSDLAGSALQSGDQGEKLPEPLRELLRARRNHIEEWRELDMRRASALGLSNGDKARRLDLDSKIEDIDRSIRTNFPEYADWYAATSVSIQGLQRRLGPDEAAYLQVVTDSGTHGFLVRRKSVTCRSMDFNRAEVRRHVKILRDNLDLARSPSQRGRFDTQAAYRLYRGTIGAFDSELSGVRHILVVPDDAFQSLPLAVLVRSEPAGGFGGLGEVDFFGRHFAVSILPSLSAIRATRLQANRRSFSELFAGFGDPTLGTPSTGNEVRKVVSANTMQSSGGIDLEAIRALPALPDTAKELRLMQERLGAPPENVVLGDAATEASVREKLNRGSYRTVSFATHGLIASDFSALAEPALVLTPPSGSSAPANNDGLLTANEIRNGISFNAEMVILSACNTGTTDASGIGGLSELARSFFLAGANSLLVSHWAVSSGATVPLLTGVIDRVEARPDTTYAIALQQSIVEMMDGRHGSRYQHPSYWAPFTLVGDGGIRFE